MKDTVIHETISFPVIKTKSCICIIIKWIKDYTEDLLLYCGPSQLGHCLRPHPAVENILIMHLCFNLKINNVLGHKKINLIYTLMRIKSSSGSTICLVKWSMCKATLTELESTPHSATASMDGFRGRKRAFTIAVILNTIPYYEETIFFATSLTYQHIEKMTWGNYTAVCCNTSCQNDVPELTVLILWYHKNQVWHIYQKTCSKQDWTAQWIYRN